VEGDLVEQISPVWDSGTSLIATAPVSFGAPRHGPSLTVHDTSRAPRQAASVEGGVARLGPPLPLAPGRALSLTENATNERRAPFGSAHATPSDGLVVDVLVLGALSVSAVGSRVTWSGTRHRALFQYLLLHTGPAHREELMELLWPGHSHSSARNNLNVSVHGLRRSLRAMDDRGDFVLYRDGCYYLNDTMDWRVDREMFLENVRRAHLLVSHAELPKAVAAAHSAIELYRGPLFQDDPAADWFASERRWLHEQYIELVERHAEWLLELGDIAGARMAAGRVLRDEPCRESVHRLLMRCYALQHQGDLVVRQYQQCVAALEQQLGISPTPETTRLYEELADTA
jgi:DNA-binding SARP family transcriptional activator